MSGIESTNRMNDLVKGLAGLINLLSLDVVAGALLSGAFAARLLDVSLALPYWAVLGISVWIMYTADHMVDAHRLGNKASTRRHLFVYRNFRLISIIVILLLLTDLWLVMTRLDLKVMYFGLAVGSATGLYFAAIHLAGGRKALLLRKEIIVALIYTAGVWGMPLLETDAGFTPVQGLLVAGFFLLALINTMLLSILDHETDGLDGHQTFSRTHGIRWTRKAALLLAILVLLVSLALFALRPALVPAMIIYVLMAGLMVSLMRSRFYRSSNWAARILTESVFWIPGLILLL